MTNKTLVWVGGVLLATGASAADMDLPHVYGRADVSVNSTEEGNADSIISTQSNASRLGVQNTHAVNDSLSVFYRLEYEVQFDERLRSSDKGFMQARNSYIGVKNEWGKLFVGIHDTPLKKAELKVDQFSDYFLADIDSVLQGQQRVSDTINIMPAKFGGVQAWAMIIPGEGASDTGADAVGGPNEDGIADALSFSLTYKSDALQLALAYDTEVKDREILRVAAQGDVGPVKLGAIIQQAERASGSVEEGLGFVVSAALKMSAKDTVKLQYVSGEDDALADLTQDINDDGIIDVTEAQAISIGWDRKLGKASKVYAYYSERIVDEDASQEFSTFGVGIRHAFGKSK